MKKLVLSLATLCCFIYLNAQPPCGFDQKHQQLLETNPEYARTIEANNRAIREYIQTHPQQNKANQQGKALVSYVIPVVVHVMHTGGAVGSIYNPTDAQIIGAINYLNDVYAGTYPGMEPPASGGAAGNLEIQFALAQRTPTCGATNGIDRVDASSLSNYVSKGINVSNSDGCPELTLKNLARWNTSDYYNIWIVNKIDSKDGTSGQFIAGFAYFPGSPSSLDGTIMLATQMIAGQKTLPHEIGHALNLYHPFQGSADNSQCPINTDCSLNGDLICDTDPVYNNYNSGTGVYSFICRTGPNPCFAPNNYSINTESNFMSYTNCYTLFTEGQKARLQAAMSLPSRASLVSGSNMALTPCGTVVNFGLTSSSQTESLTGTTSGCRTYTDYTYEMVIGSAPSADAVVTLTYSGSAVQGLDYDVTTNGDFNSPSNVLNFSSGSTTSQPFTIRIYDDGNAESAESIVLDFTVNAGGGDAAKGTDAPTFTFALTDNDLTPVGASSGTTSYLGVYNYNLATQGCFRSSKVKHRTQYLVTKDELNAAGILMAGNLTALNFRIVTKNSTKAFSGFTVALGNSTATDLSSGFVSPTFTQVYTGAYTTTTGNNVITFSTPFAWDGSSNVIINLCFENATADPSDDVMEGDIPTGNYITAYSNYSSGATAGCSLNASSISSARPRFTFDYNVAGTPVETVAGSTKALYLNNASNDYFYSENDKLLLRLNSIDASLDCVTTSLDEAGTTWASYSGGQRSQKVFAVTPTSNSSTANYTISLYFTNSELGGKNAATLKIAKTSAASVAASNSSNTILVTPTVTTLGSGVTVFTASFTGFSRFFLVDAAVTLPVNFLNFTGKQTPEKNTLINWSTASEYNNREFDIQISNDGIHFTSLATISSKGNSSFTKEYEFLHINPPSGTSWYRLKQIDMDGHSAYSNVISVTINKNVSKPVLYPVPAKNTITINFGEITNQAQIDILSADMKSVKRELIRSATLIKEIDIQGLAKGMYFIKLTTDAQPVLLKFIKE